MIWVELQVGEKFSKKSKLMISFNNNPEQKPDTFCNIHL